MSMSKFRDGGRSVPVAVVMALCLALSVGAATAQQGGAGQGPARPVSELAYVMPQTVWTSGSESSQLPQDIRIMQRIVTTALGEVAAPEIPETLRANAESPATGNSFVYSVGGSDATVLRNATVLRMSSGRNGFYSVGGRDVTGFYMQGYGYLFTVKWQVARGGMVYVGGDAGERVAELNELMGRAGRAATTADVAEARAAGEAERALQEERDRVEARQAAWDAWSAQYRDLLADALRDVVAVYGSTLKRAAADESITFMANFGGDEAETVTVSARRGELTGASRDQNLAAVHMSRGETGVSDDLRTELKIMEEIIDSSLQVERSDDVWVYTEFSRSFGGDSSYQYVPGYGVIFRKAARLNLATQVIRQVNPARREPGVVVGPLRRQIEESTEEQREAYAAHLTDLKQKTAEILATYGPTLTEMNANDWVGVFYNVGSAAGLLEGGISNFLVQARMGDIRDAGNQADGATWLLDRLVTNERQD